MHQGLSGSKTGTLPLCSKRSSPFRDKEAEIRRAILTAAVSAWPRIFLFHSILSFDLKCTVSYPACLYHPPFLFSNTFLIAQKNIYKYLHLPRKPFHNLVPIFSAPPPIPTQPREVSGQAQCLPQFQNWAYVLAVVIRCIKPNYIPIH